MPGGFGENRLRKEGLGGKVWGLNPSVPVLGRKLGASVTCYLAKHVKRKLTNPQLTLKLKLILSPPFSTCSPPLAPLSLPFLPVPPPHFLQPASPSPILVGGLRIPLYPGLLPSQLRQQRVPSSTTYTSFPYNSWGLFWKRFAIVPTLLEVKRETTLWNTNFM